MRKLQILQNLIVKTWVAFFWLVVGGKHILGMQSLIFVQFLVDALLNNFDGLSLCQQINDADDDGSDSWANKIDDNVFKKLNDACLQQDHICLFDHHLEVGPFAWNNVIPVVHNDGQKCLCAALVDCLEGLFIVYGFHQQISHAIKL